MNTWHHWHTLIFLLNGHVLEKKKKKIHFRKAANRWKRILVSPKLVTKCDYLWESRI